MQQQIYINKTPEIAEALSKLRRRYSLLSEAKIIEIALSEIDKKELAKALDEEQKLRKAYNHAMAEGKKIGERLMREKGLDPKKVTEQEYYDIILNDHKHDA